MIIGLLLAAVLTLQGAPQPGVGRHAISLTVSAASDVIKLNSDVKINVVVTNISDHKIMLTRSNGKAEGEFLNRVNVRDEQGSDLAKTRYNRVLRRESADSGPQDTIRMSTISVPVGPGESITEQIIVNKLYDFSKPGKYAIQVEREDPSIKTNVDSNIITITVTP